MQCVAKEWEPAKAGMVVPLNPREMRSKVDAIQRHQSQKDRPLFPGADPREFWQRALARNEARALGFLVSRATALHVADVACMQVLAVRACQT